MFFSSEKHQFSRTPNKFFSEFGLKKLALISKLQKTWAKKQRGNPFQTKQLVNHVLRAGNFLHWAEYSHKNLYSSFFLCRGRFRNFFFLDLKAFFQNVRLKAPGFSKIFQQCFAKCIQDAEDSVLVFFLPQFHSWAFRARVSGVDQKHFGSVFKSAFRLCERNNLVCFLSSKVYQFSRNPNGLPSQFELKTIRIDLKSAQYDCEATTWYFLQVKRF